MESVRAAKPVKLFIAFAAPEDNSLAEDLEERLIAEFGPTDHRLSLIPSGGTIHRVFLSFDRLIETGSLAEIRERSASIEEEYSAKLDLGFLDNRRIATARGDGADVVQFKDGGLHFFPWTPPEYSSDKCQEFFLQMRKSFRAQLRSMCLRRL